MTTCSDIDCKHNTDGQCMAADIDHTTDRFCTTGRRIEKEDYDRLLRQDNPHWRKDRSK
jgi:hypothetical protein